MAQQSDRDALFEETAAGLGLGSLVFGLFASWFVLQELNAISFGSAPQPTDPNIAAALVVGAVPALAGIEAGRAAIARGGARLGLAGSAVSSLALGVFAAEAAILAWSFSEVRFKWASAAILTAALAARGAWGFSRALPRRTSTLPSGRTFAGVDAIVSALSTAGVLLEGVERATEPLTAESASGSVGSETLDVATFDGKAARNAWLRAARASGGGAHVVGPNWAVVAESEELAGRVAAALGGDRA